jgi:ligand-binding SRPBCC domain-containing protein
MPTLVIETFIQAPVQRCFDLARDIRLHCVTASHTEERAIAGVTEGRIGLGEWVTFEGVHFGVRQRLTARVIEFDSPHRFVDEMLEGAFQSMKHVHAFIENGQWTLMRDTLIWVTPFGWVGRAADKLFLERYMRHFLMKRNAKLKVVAETDSTAI